MKIQNQRVFSAALAFSAMLMVSCDQNNNNGNDEQKDAKEIAEEHNDAKFNKAKEKDAQFLVDAVALNLKEIKVSEMAMKNASSAKVKELAGSMVTEHKKAMDELRKLAEKKMVTVPTEADEDAVKSYDNLEKKGGSSFDKDYVDMMVDDHKDAVEKFDKASTDSEDYEIKSTANKMLPDLRTHLDHFMDLQESLKDNSTTRTTATSTTHTTTGSKPSGSHITADTTHTVNIKRDNIKKGGIKKEGVQKDVVK